MKKVYVLLSLIFLVLLAVSSYKNILITENVLFWTFSTIVQAFVGLLALLGMTGIFKLQSLDAALNQILEANMFLVQYFKGSSAQAYIQEKAIAELNKISKETHDASEIQLSRVKIVSRKLNDIIEKRKTIRNNVLNFTGRTIFVVLFSLVSLPITPILSREYLGLPFLVIAVMLSLYSLTSTIRLMRALL